MSLGNYTPMYFDRDSHFFNLEVNTTHSSVHVPTNVFDQSPESDELIQWSEVLDEVFKQNYQSDPALSWQYFGSNLGIMRHFPAMAWNRNKTDTYDCRKRSWYIETATCSKDVVILIDNSGSMTGYRNYIAQLTIKSLLDTFSNNDFFNVYNYSKEVKELVPCFKDKLVQATPENIRVFNEHVKKLVPEGHANVSIALEQAFKLLEFYRHKRKCNESSTGCNQVIMLVTDGVPGNATEVFEKYNWFGNDSRAPPVRIFTYLLGKEVTKVKEIQLYACLNRGYYSHVQSLDEVAEEVLKYVNVIAAPLVLQKQEHPPTWTHAYIDTTYETDQQAMTDGKPDFRMMIAVGVPAFNLSSYGEGNYTGRPTLLGVAGTDVPIDDIIKLALPYKLGVNGYSFIVSNNGYVLLHPDLRPIDPKYPDEIKDNYNSIDIIEIEQLDEDLPPRVTSNKLLELREHLVQYRRGQMLEVPVRFHYDEMKRVARTKQDFYFAPIPHTPFSLGIALPSGYGNTWIKVGDEIKGNTNTKINISDFFVGENWKVHPDWVYCKYHYLEGHEFNSSEEELRHFLKKIVEPDWIWSSQYGDEPAEKEKKSDELNCGRKSFDDDSYYCNKELVELLVFDAKITNNSYQTWSFRNEREQEIVEGVNATVRFVATMSGLTRWQFIFGEVEVEHDTEFGDLYATALNETWYKSAILQHEIEQQSFVYSVPHKVDREEGTENIEEQDIKVTASMAIFPRDGGIEAAGCVVGFQFSHELLKEKFLEITSENSGGYTKACGDDGQVCYVIDNNGYIIISEESLDNSNDTGVFFGEKEKNIMLSMVHANIFRQMTIYDLQGLCLNVTDVDDDSAGPGLTNPFKLMFLGFQWILTELFFELSRAKFWFASAQDIEFDYVDEAEKNAARQKVKVIEKPNSQSKKPPKGMSQEDEIWFKQWESREKEKEKNYYPCDKKAELFVLQQDFILYKHRYALTKKTNGSRPFFVNKIPHSNLLLVVVDKTQSDADEEVDVDDEGELTTKPQEMETGLQYGKEHPCHKLYMSELERRRLDECFTEHEDEEVTSYCGSSSRKEIALLLVIAPILYFVRNFI